MAKQKLYLDDMRMPRNQDWTIVRSYQEFIDWVTNNGVPDYISFDHDLGEEKSGFDCAKWLCNYCLDSHIPLPEFSVHSANPVGRENIESIMNNYTKRLNVY